MLLPLPKYDTDSNGNGSFEHVVVVVDAGFIPRPTD